MGLYFISNHTRMIDRNPFFFIKKMTRTKAEGTDSLSNDPFISNFAYCYGLNFLEQ